jgi:hypothetical protein
MRTSSRKHLLAGQKTVTTTTVARRLSVRIPTMLSNLLAQAVKESDDSRNKWVSETLELFRQKYVVELLAFGSSEPSPEYLREVFPEHSGLSDEAILKLELTVPEKIAEADHKAAVDQGLLILVKEAKIPESGGVQLQILLNDEGLYAMQDMLTRIDQIKDPDLSTHGFKTVLTHIALWDRIMVNRDISDITTMVMKKTRQRSKNSSK